MKQCLIDKITIVLQRVPVVAHLARKKFVARFLIGLIKSRKVQFCEIAHHLNDVVKPASNETRIQNFFRHVALDYTALALVLVSLLPRHVKLRLCVDRTEWDFGKCQVNILLVTVGHGDLHWPLCWELLDNKSGNSNAADRIRLLDFCLQVLGRHRIGLVVGDREFVGHTWFKYLKENGLQFVMRVPKHHQLTDREGGRQDIRAWDLQPGQGRQLAECQVDGVWGAAQVTALAGGEYLFLFGTVPAAFMGPFYRKRWTIEACFQNLKGRGFDLRSSHLQCRDKLKKLLALVSLAYALCLSLGNYYHRKVKNIAIKKHGRKSTSFSRRGLDVIREITRPGPNALQQWIARLEVLVRWILSQVAYLQ